jgi:dihydrofolate reductase
VRTGDGKVSLRLAMSLDGFIADRDGRYDWARDMPSAELDTEHQIPFDQYLRDVNVVVMGHRCFEQHQHAEYVQIGKPVIVAASRPHPHSARGVEFTDEVLTRVQRERDDGRHCFLFGGGRLVTSFVQADLVDEFTVGIVPVLLGQGRPLFREGRRRIELRLVDSPSSTARHDSSTNDADPSRRAITLTDMLAPHCALSPADIFRKRSPMLWSALSGQSQTIAGDGDIPGSGQSCPELRRVIAVMDGRA